MEPSEADEREEELTQDLLERSAIAKHIQDLDVLRAKEEQQAAEEEWSRIEGIPVGTESTSICSRIVTFEEALEHLKEQDLSAYMARIKPTVRRRGLSLLLHHIWGPPKLKLALVPQRNFIFALAQCPFDGTDRLHLQVLQTIYRKLCNATYDCPRYGHHWERIGFQGNDPSTDLRGVGVLGLLHLLFLSISSHNFQVGKEIYKMSRHSVQDFPFAVMSLNMSKVALEALREEALNKCCNARDDVVQVVNEFYAGTFLLLYLKWRDQKMTIRDSGYVLKDVAQLAKKRPAYIMENLKRYQETCCAEEDRREFANFTNVVCE